MTTIHSISLTVTVSTPNNVPRILEVLARASGGLLLDGIESSIYSHQFDDAEIDTE
jgi:hypothetical protein